MDKYQVRSCISGSGSITYDPDTGVIGGGGGGGVTPAALTKTDDTNVTLTLGGTPATALLQATSLTLGWTGQLAVARGGTGLSALGTANQLIRVNAGATALEYFTPSYLTGLTVSTTPITSGTAGRILYEGVGNVLQENSGFNFDVTTGSQIIGGATARGTRQTIVNSANTYATKIFVQRNAADSADYTSIRGDGAIDFANIAGSTANNLIYANGITLVTTFGSAATYNSQFGMGNAYSYTGGALNYNTMVGALNTLQVTTGIAETSTTLGFSNTLRNSNYCNIMGAYTRMNGATRCNIIGGRGTSLRDITGTDTTIIGTCTEPNGVGYTGSLVTYFNNAYSSHWFYKNGNIGLFGQKAYQILTDNSGAAANRLSTYMDLTATNTLTIHNGTATAANIADAIQIYAADVSAGNAALYVRDEAGRIFYAGTNVGMQSNHNLQLAANNTVYATLRTTGAFGIANLAADPSGNNGDLYYNTANNKFRGYENGAWADLVQLTDSGTYTPTLTGVTNVSSTTAFTCQYMRVGNVVTVSGKISVTATTNNSQTVLGISLPIASNFAAEENCGGLAHTINNTAADQHGASIYADATNDRATFEYYETHGSADVFTFTFTYRII